MTPVMSPAPKSSEQLRQVAALAKFLADQAVNPTTNPTQHDLARVQYMNRLLDWELFHKEAR